ncbi:BACE2 secretase, partial [Polyodon spathula]|nr:BACE2 secretase [Polyodon spathula]
MVFFPSTCNSKFTFPLKIYPGNFNSSVDIDFSSLEKNESSSTNGISLATDPSGKVNFLQMVNNLQGDSGRGYYIEMLLGTPSQTLNVLVDTGSSNFAVAGAPDPYITHFFNSKLSSSYQSSGMDVSVRYTKGNWVGKLGTDIVTIPKGPNGTVTVNVATILQSENFFLPRVNWQGILGLAYKMLARPDSSVEPFFDSLVRQTGIPDMFSLQMCGAGRMSASSTLDPLGGGLVMGGIEPTLYKGSIWYTPIKEEWYYQVEVLKLEVGGQNLNLDCQEYNTDKAIVDSGTTLLRLPQNVFNAVVDAIIRTSLIQQFSSGFWTGTKLACWTKGETQWSFFPKISIYLRGMNASQSFHITILPQLYIQLVADVDDTLECYRFGITSSTSGLVIGATVMEGFYVTFDRAQKKIGFAVSTCAEKNGSPLSEIGGPFPASDISSNCAETPAIREPVLWIISYALMGLCAFILIILVILLLVPCRHGDDTEGGVTDESSLIRHRFK